MELGYWPIKGVAEYIRWVLAYTGTEYTERNPTNWDHWTTYKFTLGLDFPNLPYLIEGEFKLTESQAIAWYVAAKFKPELLGETDKETADIDMISGVIQDVLQPFTSHLMAKDNQKEMTEKTISKMGTKGKIEQLSNFLGDKEFFLGKPTLSDIEFAATAYRVHIYARSLGLEDPISQYGNLIKLVERVRQLPGIKEHIASAAWKRPIHTPGLHTVNFIEEDA